MAVQEKKIILSEPLKVGGEDVVELTMKKLTVGMMLDANVMVMTEHGIEPTNAIVEPYALALACNVPAAEVLKMTYVEYGKMQVAQHFLTEGGVDEEEPAKKIPGEDSTKEKT